MALLIEKRIGSWKPVRRIPWDRRVRVKVMHRHADLGAEATPIRMEFAQSLQTRDFA